MRGSLYGTPKVFLKLLQMNGSLRYEIMCEKNKRGARINSSIRHGTQGIRRGGSPPVLRVLSRFLRQVQRILEHICFMKSKIGNHSGGNKARRKHTPRNNGGSVEPPDCGSEKRKSYCITQRTGLYLQHEQEIAFRSHAVSRQSEIGG
jgi:hypothetical protein